MPASPAVARPSRGTAAVSGFAVPAGQARWEQPSSSYSRPDSQSSYRKRSGGFRQGAVFGAGAFSIERLKLADDCRSGVRSFKFSDAFPADQPFNTVRTVERSKAISTGLSR